MKTDTETLVVRLRANALWARNRHKDTRMCNAMQQAADRLEELEDALRDLLTVSDPLFSYGVKELHASRARARKALGMDK